MQMAKYKRGETFCLDVICKDVVLTYVSEVIFALNKANAETPTPTLKKVYPADVTAEQTTTGVIFHVPLNQSETLKFNKQIFVEGQIKYTDNTSISKTVTIAYDIDSTTYTEIIPGNAANAGQANCVPMSITGATYINVSFATIDANVTRSETAASTAEQARDIAVSSKIQAVAAEQSVYDAANRAATSETNAKTSEDNAKISETNSKTSETITAQAMTDYLAMLGVDVATLVGGKIPMSQIPATATQEIYQIASQSELTSLVAQHGDLAELIETVDGEPTITKAWQLLGDGNPTIPANWIVWGTSYAVQAGNATTATNAENANKINNHRLVEIAEADWATAVKDAGTYYLVY